MTVTSPEDPGRTRLRDRRAPIASSLGPKQWGGRRDPKPHAGDGAEGRGRAGDEVEPGQVLVVVEAMKMENEIVAHHAGVVEGVSVGEGDQVTGGQELITLA